MKTITYWEARRYGDCEGRSTKVLGKFFNRLDAYERAEGNDGFGKTIEPNEVKIIIYESYQESIEDEMKKEIADKKLTKEQIEYIKNNM